MLYDPLKFRTKSSDKNCQRPLVVRPQSTNILGSPTTTPNKVVGTCLSLYPSPNVRNSQSVSLSYDTPTPHPLWVGPPPYPKSRVETVVDGYTRPF